MATLLHLIATDVRRFRWPIAGWLILVVAAATFDRIGPGLDPRLLTHRAGALLLVPQLLGLAVLLLSVLLPAMIVQADPPIGSDAFWMTRPIDPVVLLLAKGGLAAGLIVGSPLLAQTVLMTVERVPVSSLARVLFESALFRFAILLASIALASLTRDVGRFVLLVIVSFAAFVLGAVIEGIVTSSQSMSTLPAVPDVRPIADNTYVLAGLAGLIVAAALTLYLQYRFRSRLRSGVAAAVTATAAILLAHVWTWPLIEKAPPVPAWAGQAAAVRLLVDPAGLGFDEPQAVRSPTDMEHFARGRVSLAAMERGWIADLNLIGASVMLDGESRTSPGMEDLEPTLGDSGEYAAVTALRDLLGVRWIGLNYDARVPRSRQPVLFILPDAEFARLSGKTGRYEGRLRVDLTEMTIAARFPVEPGRTLTRGAHRIAVLGVRRDSGGLLLQIRERDAQSILDRTPRSSLRHFLVNAAAGEAIEGRITRSGSGAPSVLDAEPFKASAAMGLGITFSDLLFPGKMTGSDAPQWSRDASWFDRVDLVIVARTPSGSLVRALEIPQFQIRAASQ